ncbi:16S rRNA (guanine(527)-N(7))-methyltransferase RsmG [Sphingomonas sp. KC8]|uniref:16S rRNA (guanine(527)-N(7))-methyltransferase RsmG n=1 Tax=Sphingomonas sp. KC8 TaxID=1030157 RepID=UPI000248AB03|nr:16S rRNA (guanine(527)-N(7))-methyltransferase RsmG [Sphingomonas sp. KC8]ARS28109.1 methyltransferase GidB [Sphingomonas sp. KC8]
MTEDEARAWIADHIDVPRETWERLDTLVACVVEESGRQNLIAASTVPAIWARHIVDSAQLLRFGVPGPWLDLGAGAGFPGLVVAAFGGRAVTLVESRRKRIDFLVETADRMGIADLVTVVGQRLEIVESQPFSVISARAFAPLDRLLALAHRFATPTTQWVLPKGRSAQTELDHVRQTWQGAFRIEASVTDPEAGVVVATNVRPKTLSAGKAR